MSRFFSVRYFGVVALTLGMCAVLLARFPSDYLLNDLSIYDRANWWDPHSSFAILHKMNEVRVPYFLSHFPHLADRDTLAVADIGCGGGFVSEAIANHSSEVAVTGIDISERSIEVAKLHADEFLESGNLMYLVGSIYAIPLPSSSQDIVIASDLLEHLEDVPAALKEIFRVLRPGGVFVFDTIAKTWWSWLATFLVAQEILGIVEPGAHDWSLFIPPGDLARMLAATGFVSDKSEWLGLVGEIDMIGAILNLSKFELIGGFHTSKHDLSSSYMGYAKKPVKNRRMHP